MKKLVIRIVLVNLLAACANQPPKTPEAAAPVPAPAAAETTPAPEATTTTTPLADVDPLSDAASLLAKRSIYYPFDVSAVQDADKPTVEAHAKYLSEHPDRKVHIEGNTDERGSNEYNLALGQRRADSVKQMLIVGGAKASQIETASYGEEKPKATGHDEAAWSQNRRSDIKY
jgi:peptidoglycan-associated lipoprotein